MNNLRGVFDNNILISAVLLRTSVPRQAFDKLLDHGKVLISVPVMLELAEVLSRTKFDKYITQDERMRFLVNFLKVAEMVEISESITVCCDPKDDKLLELAVFKTKSIVGLKNRFAREKRGKTRKVFFNISFRVGYVL